LRQEKRGGRGLYYLRLRPSSAGGSGKPAERDPRCFEPGFRRRWARLEVSLVLAARCFVDGSYRRLTVQPSFVDSVYFVVICYSGQRSRGSLQCRRQMIPRMLYGASGVWLTQKDHCRVAKLYLRLKDVQSISDIGG
jgi:hypothetical protein